MPGTRRSSGRHRGALGSYRLLVLVLTGSLDSDAFAAVSALPDSLRPMDATRRMVDVSGAGHLEVPVAEAASR